MKTIGMIGGMSWESTATYYRIINQKIKEQLGGLHSAKCILHSVDFDEIEKYQTAGQWEQAGLVLQSIAKQLENAGAEMIILCTNTMHKVSDLIEAGIEVPFWHIADATAAALKEKHIKRSILLGTQYTMEQNFIKEKLQDAGIDMMIPELEERIEINRIIFNELCLGITKRESKDYMLKVIRRLQAEGGQAVILGCTEIGLLIQQDDCTVPAIDTAIVHAESTAELAVKSI